MESAKPSSGSEAPNARAPLRAEPREKLKLHLGCGKRVLPGFVHVDRADFPHIDYRSGVDRLPMFGNDSAELIYSSHVLEYFDRFEARAVIEEWKRVLSPGGMLRVAVPDFEALADIYFRDRNLDLILGPLYGRMEAGGRTIYHRTVYDFAALRALLEGAGFEQVRHYDWRETIHRDVDDHSQAYIPHMDKEHGTLVSLNVECRKPLAPARSPAVAPSDKENS
jgi:predicted SAM-dependent methyltransferase